MHKRLVLAVVALSLLSMFGIQHEPVAAQSPLDRARDDVAAATERLEQHVVDLDETQARGDELARIYWQVQSGVERLDIDIAASLEITASLAAERQELQAEVRVVALDQYVSQSEDISTAAYESEADRAASEALARLVIGADNTAVNQLAGVDEAHDRARAKLEAERREQADALAEVESTQAALTDELTRLGELRQQLDRELVELETALGVLEEVEAQRQAAAAEQARIDEERQRAEAAAAAAAELARRPTPVPAPAPTATAQPTATQVPNPQLPEVTATRVPNPQLPEVTATQVPNPQPSEPLPTAVPNPQPSGPVVPSGGGIVCPLNGPFTHTDDFNAPRAVGGVHRANDLISPQGTPVLAVASGTVEHRDSRVGGLSAHLKGDNGDYYFYTHLSGYENVGAGRVAAGTVIGYVGMTGNAPIPHLHFEIHSGGYGNYSNPYGPVRAACF